MKTKLRKKIKKSREDSEKKDVKLPAQDSDKKRVRTRALGSEEKQTGEPGPRIFDSFIKNGLEPAYGNRKTVGVFPTDLRRKGIMPEPMIFAAPITALHGFRNCQHLPPGFE